MRKFAAVLFAIFLAKAAKADMYIVKRGDTLAKIARRYRTKVRVIRRLNGLRTNLIFPGQMLIVPGRELKFKPKKSELTIDLLENEAMNFLSDTASFYPERSGKLYELASQVKQESLLLSNETSLENFKSWSLGVLNLPKYKGTFLSLLVRIFENFKNTPYVFGYSNPSVGLDCSSFTMLVFRKLGVNLPRTARAQFGVGMPVDKNHLKIGDLVFFRTYARFPSHVGIYVGNGKFVHFSTSNHGLAISSLEDPYFKKRYIGARRVLSDRKVKELVARASKEQNNM